MDQTGGEMITREMEGVAPPVTVTAPTPTPAPISYADIDILKTNVG